MLRQPFSQLPDGVDMYEGFPVSNWERLFDGVDLQLGSSLRYACGQGRWSGLEIQTAKTLTPGTAAVGNAQGVWFGALASNYDLTSLLTDNHQNVVWVCPTRMPTTGADAWPGYESTFNAGKLLVKVQDTAPPNSLKLGTLTLAGGVVTAVDNHPAGSLELYAAGYEPWTGYVDFTPAGSDAEWVECDHSADISFGVPGKVTYWNPKAGGFDIGPIVNCEPDRAWVLITPPDVGDPYYGAATVRLYLTIWGVPAK